MKNITKSLMALAMLFITITSSAQISQGGSPYSLTNIVPFQNKSLATVSMQSPDMNVLAAEDVINDSRQHYRIGLNMPVNLNQNNSGKWQMLPNGGRLWRLVIHSDDAMALGLYYNNFYIPNGGQVFLYNETKDHVIGSFTDANNVKDQIRATQMIEGETITIEYYEAPGTIGLPSIEIKEVVYFYRGVEDFVNGIAIARDGAIKYGLEKAESCQVDVACTPESTGWSNQIDATVFYTFSSGGGTAMCSASMINNTALDCTPYIISAWHCGEPSAGTNISSTVWYWNYQKTSCSTGTGNSSNPNPGTQTMTGGTVVASSGNGTLNTPPGANQLAGSDFYLVELSSEPPTAYNAYYNGWNRANTAATSGVCVHHPAGSAKKISTFTSSLNSATYNGGASGAHWSVQWAATTNGHGVTEGGSSGSPIFDQNGRTVGQLSGGSSFCSTPTQTDLYGKFYTDWDQCGTSATAQLAPWLDPGNTGAITMDGTYQPCTATAPTCGITASSTTITVGGTVTFSDGSSGGPDTWAWNFDNTSQGGVSPASSTSQNPGTVTYSTVGTYEVELTASNAQGTCTTTISITVNPVPASLGCDTLLNITDTDTLRIYSANGGYLAGWNDYLDISKAEKYSGYAPYTYVNGMAIYFYGINDGGNGATVDFNIWDDNAGEPGTIIGTQTFSLASVDGALTAGQGILEITYSPAIDVSTGTFYCGITMNGFGTNDSLGIVTNSLYDPTINSGWEQWADLSWNDMETAWGDPVSQYISPYVTDLPVTGSASSNITTTCAGGSINFSSTGTNVTGYNWYTTGGTPATSTNQNETVTYATAGNYTAYLVLDGVCSGQVIDSVEIVITSGPTTTATTTDPGCAGNDGQIIVAATGGASPYTYSVDGGTTFQSSDTFTGLPDGTYNVVALDASGCQGTFTATLNPGSGALAVSSTTVDPTCNGNGSITSSISGGTAPFTWSTDGGTTFNSGTNPNTFTSLASGTYNIVASDANGCQGTENVTLNVATGGPSETSTSINATCNNANDGSITINASGGTPPFSYSIDGGANFTAGSTNTGLSAGSYDVIVIDGNGCQTTINTLTITEPTSVSHNATTTNASCGSNNGSITATGTGGTAPYTYSNDNGSSFQSSGSFTSLGANTYQVIVMDANGCSSFSSTETIAGTGNVTTSAAPVNETCAASNGSIVLTGTGGSSPYQYSIDGGATFQSSGSFTGLSSGTYNVVIEDAGGCQGLNTSTITNTGGFIATVSSSQTICFGSSTTITSGGAGSGGTYTWDGGLGTGATQVVSPASTTTYTVTMVDGSGCTENASVTITVETEPTVTITPSNPVICGGESVTLTASGAQTYNWNTGATSASITVSPTNQTTYTVIGQNGVCQGAAVSSTISVNLAPVVIAGSDQTLIVAGGTINFSNSGSGATSYSWSFGDGGSSTIGSPSHTYPTAGTYTVILTGTLGNCSTSDTITINVGFTGFEEINLEESVNLYPNPNNGEFNLSLNFTIEQDVEVRIFNTIGELLDIRTLNNTSSSIIEFNLNDNAEGFYFVNIKTKNESVTKRISIIR